MPLEPSRVTRKVRNIWLRLGSVMGWLGNLDSNQDRRSQSPLFYR